MTSRSSATEVQHATSVLSNGCLLLTLPATRSHEQNCGQRGEVLRTELGPTRKDLTPEGKKLHKQGRHDGQGMWHAWGREINKRFWWEESGGKNHLQDLSADRRFISITERNSGTAQKLPFGVNTMIERKDIQLYPTILARLLAAT